MIGHEFRKESVGVAHLQLFVFILELLPSVFEEGISDDVVLFQRQVDAPHFEYFFVSQNGISLGDYFLHLVGFILILSGSTLLFEYRFYILLISLRHVFQVDELQILRNFVNVLILIISALRLILRRSTTLRGSLFLLRLHSFLNNIMKVHNVVPK